MPREALRSVLPDVDGKPPDEALSALHEIDGPSEDQTAGVAGAQRRFALSGIVAKVEFHHLLVALQGIVRANDEIRGGRYVADLRPLVDQRRGQFGKARLIHVRLGAERGDEAADQLDIAVHIAFELRPQHAGLPENGGAEVLFVDRLVQVMRVDRSRRDDDEGYQSRDVRPPENGARQSPQASLATLSVHYLTAIPAIQGHATGSCLTLH